MVQSHANTLSRGDAARADHAALILGSSQHWGWSGRERCLRVLMVGWMNSLSEAEAGRAVVDGAAYLEQAIGAAS